MYATIQTPNQLLLKLYAGKIANIKTIRKTPHDVLPIFEITIDCGETPIDPDDLQKIPNWLIKMEGEPYPDGWLVTD